MKASSKPVLVVGAAEANIPIIKNALQSEYKLYFAKTKSEAEKYMKKNTSIIFCILLDTTVLGDIAINMINEWYASLDFQLIPLIAIFDHKDHKMRKDVINTGVVSILSTPFDESILSAYIKSVDKRIMLSEERIKENYEDAIKTNKNKVFVVINAIDCCVFFLRNDEDELFFEYANEKALKVFGNVNYDQLLAQFDIDESAKILNSRHKFLSAVASILPTLGISLIKCLR